MAIFQNVNSLILKIQSTPNIILYPVVPISIDKLVSFPSSPNLDILFFCLPCHKKD